MLGFQGHTERERGISTRIALLGAETAVAMQDMASGVRLEVEEAKKKLHSFAVYLGQCEPGVIGNFWLR